MRSSPSIAAEYLRASRRLSSSYSGCSTAQLSTAGHSCKGAGQDPPTQRTWSPACCRTQLTMALRIKYAFFFTEFWASLRNRCCKRGEDKSASDHLEQSASKQHTQTSLCVSEHPHLFLGNGKGVGVHLCSNHAALGVGPQQLHQLITVLRWDLLLFSRTMLQPLLLMIPALCFAIVSLDYAPVLQCPVAWLGPVEERQGASSVPRDVEGWSGLDALWNVLSSGCIPLLLQV